MNLLRRRFLGSSLLVLGSSLLDALTTPLWKWRGTVRLEAEVLPNPSVPNSTPTSPVQFVDVAREAGLTIPNVWGGADHKKYIIEAKGSGLAFFDYDQDGWLDIYLTNGTRFNTDGPAGKAPTSHLYKNNRDGTFADVTEKSGLARTGWQTGVCVGDYDNDGWDDLFCCFWGHNILFHNNGDGTFTDVTRKAGVYDEQIRWGAGCTWLDYDRDGRLDLFVCNYIKLDPEPTPSKNDPRQCQWKGIPVMCGPRGLTRDTNVLFHNNGDGTFTDVSAKSGILKPGPRYSITAVAYDFDNDGWPDVYVAVDSEPSILFRNNHDGTFTDVAVIAGCAYSENGHEQAGMGVAVADYDNDGDMDALVLNMNDPPSLLRNDGGSLQNWIKIKLIGTKCNRTAIGARVRVITGKHAQMDEVHSGTSVMSQSDLRLHFGLGEFQTVDLIEVRWPTTQKVERFTQVKANQILTIREGSGIVSAYVPKSK